MEDLPIWAQGAGAVAIIVSSTVLAIYKYFKTDKKELADVPPVVAALDEKVLKEIQNELNELSENITREMKKNNRLLDDLKSVIQDNTEATFMQTEVYGKLVRMLRSFIRVNNVLDGEL